MADTRDKGSGTLRAACSAGPDCVPLEMFERLLDGVLPIVDRSRIELHLATCAHCKSELELFRAFREDQPGRNEAPSVKFVTGELRRRSPEIFPEASRRRTRSFLPAFFRIEFWPGTWRKGMSFAAASLMLIVSAGLFLRESIGPGLPAGPGGANNYRSQSLALTAPQGDVAPAPAEFRWSEIPGAARYQVRLVEVDRTEVWKSEAATGAIAIPGEVRRLFAPGRTFLWEVRAFNAKGESLAVSNLQIFHILATAP